MPVSNSLWYLALVPGIPTIALLGWTKWFIHCRDKRSRRPFDEMPRPAGWSLQNRTGSLMEDFILFFMVANTAGLVAWALATHDKGSPAFILSVGFVACGLLYYRAYRSIRSCMNHRLGLLGEQVTGQILDQLSSDSIRVFHDLEIREPGKKPWNIDHVVITPAGVFAIETKTRRKPRGIAPDGQQGHKVIFDGQQLRFPAPMAADRHGLDQTQRNADWLTGKLATLNGCAVPVTPVLVLPGWWVEAKGKGPVTVLNPKGLRSFLNGRAPALSAERQSAIAAQLEERCRIDLSRPA
jgi:hypothetical protein